MKLLLLIILFGAVNAVDYHENDFSNVKFIFTGTEANDIKILSEDDDFSTLSNTKYFDVNKKTMIYVHGWRLSCNTTYAQSIITAYMTRRSEFNIICVDWSNYTNNFVIVTTLLSLDGVSSCAKSMLVKMKNQLFPNTNHYIHLIGFNFGAHLAGYIGRKFGVDRITGLDPSGFFSYTNLIFQFAGVLVLNKNDAKQVDIIHTSAGKFGFHSGTGHLDFFVNGGCTQCGCTFIDSLKEFLKDQRIESIYTLACSHIRAVEYYAESVYRNSSCKPFHASACDPFGATFTNSTCTNNRKQISMGFHASFPVCDITTAIDCLSTNYFVSTHPQCPYSMH